MYLFHIPIAKYNHKHKRKRVNGYQPYDHEFEFENPRVFRFVLGICSVTFFFYALMCFLMLNQLNKYIRNPIWQLLPKLYERFLFLYFLCELNGAWACVSRCKKKRFCSLLQVLFLLFMECVEFIYLIQNVVI